ncbi:hypothetical protein [Duganella radicis]|nr:hypothetical protein [Duganella radicis]
MDNVDLQAGAIYACLKDHLPLPNTFRLLDIQVSLNGATVIGIPEVRIRGEGKQKYYYAGGFQRIQLSELREWLMQGLIKPSNLQLPPFWMMSDEQLTVRFSRTKNSEDRPKALKTRDFKWSLIEPIVPPPLGTGAIPPNLSYLDSLVTERAKAAGVSPGQVFDALHRFYAFHCLTNSLLPNRLGRCGNPGQKRVGKNSKLGRKNTAAKLGDDEQRGLMLTHDDIQHIEDCFQLISPGTTSKDAYDLMGRMFYNSGNEYKNGVVMPQLLPKHLRPTYNEFMYRGTQSVADGGAARRIMGEGKWLRDFRPLSGTATDGLTAIGQTGSVDASPIDVHTVSITNPCQPIGVGRAVFVRDVYSGLFVGWSLSINNPKAEDAKLAILRAAESKKNQLRKYGLNFPESDFPSIFFSRYHSDNGELRCKDAMFSIGDELKRSIEYVPARRADLNSPSETGHQLRHKTLDQKLPGATFGRQRERGETPPIENAVLSRFAYMRMLLDWVHWYNVRKQLPLSEIPAEMRRDFASRKEELPRNRLGIFKWAITNGYSTGRPLPLDLLRAHLLPRYKASIRRDGIVLHRPATGDVVELLRGARFNDAYLVESGMMREAIHRRTTHIEVRADPDDLSCVYIIDDNGIHCIPNILGDALLIKEGTISDLCGLNDEERLLNVLSAGKVDQDNADLASMREETVMKEHERQKAHAAALEATEARRPPLGIKEAQAEEKRSSLDAALADYATFAPTSEPEPPSPPRPDIQDSASSPTSSTLNSLEQHRMNKLLEFMGGKAQS